MASISFQGLTSFVQQQIAALQAAAGAIIDSTVGSITLAWSQAVSAVALFLQAQVVQAIALTRFATSYNSDADSWGAQFDFDRLGATFSTGSATFARATPTQQALIAGGSVVNGVLTGGAVISTGPGGAQYMVTIDTANAAWNAILDAYVLAANVSSITLPIQALAAGSDGNVLANTITSFFTPIVGIDTVTNGAALTNGLNAESDTAYKARLPLFLAGLVGATEAAILSALTDVQQGLAINLLENETPSGSTQLGAFTAVIDDGSGSPPSSLLSSATAAVEAARGFTIQAYVTGPTVITPTIALSVRVASGFVSASVTNAVQAAVVTFINTIEAGDDTDLYIALIEQAALGVAGVVSVQPGATTINSTAADLALTAFQKPRVTSSNVTCGTY